MKNPPLTYADIISHIEQLDENPKALNKDLGEGKWEVISTKELIQTVRNITLGLHSLGVRKGECIGLLALPSPQWTLIDLSIVLSGAINVPLFSTIAEENFVYESQQTEIKTLIVDGIDQWNLFIRHEHLFDRVITIGNLPEHPKKIPLHSVIALGEKRDVTEPSCYENLKNQLSSSDLCLIIYTSGSTGVPKGVELTQENVICEIEYKGFNWNSQTDRYLSILPLEHVFGHCVNLWMLFNGVSIYYSLDYKNLGSICLSVKPTIIVLVPRLLEKIHAKILDKIDHSSFLKKWIATYAINIAKKDEPSWFSRLIFPLLDQLVYSHFRLSLGGHLRVIISGGAALSPHLQRFFHAISMNIYQGWGLTEACPLSVNTPGRNKIGTVGHPLEKQKISLSQDGEILVKGPLVMRGYHHDPFATAKAIDKEGWLHTGDKGEIDREGFLKIIGRMKELFKTSTGEYVAPVPIEQALTTHPLIDMAMVIADGKKFTSCLLFPNFEVLARWKIKKKANGMSDEAFLNSELFTKKFSQFLEEINQHLNHSEQIHAYRFVMEPLTIQKGDLTPSMKIRREAITKKYANIIEEMYEEMK